MVAITYPQGREFWMVNPNETEAREDFLNSTPAAEVFERGGLDMDELRAALGDIDVVLIRTYFRTGRERKAIDMLCRPLNLIARAEHVAWQEEKAAREQDHFYVHHDPEKDCGQVP